MSPLIPEKQSQCRCRCRCRSTWKSSTAAWSNQLHLTQRHFARQRHAAWL